jgi:hypothetical protein
MIARRRQWVNGFWQVQLLFPVAQTAQGRQEKDEGKRMARNGNPISKLIAVLTVFALMMALFVPKVSAQVTTFSTSTYKGSYSCRYAYSFDFFTAVSQYNPDGTGAYTTGTLVGTLNAFAPFATTPPASAFCTYFLETAASAYSINATGLGFETLSWTPSVANNGACPGAFIDQTQIALRNLTVAGASIRAEVADDDLFGFGEIFPSAGHATCLGG